MKEWKDNPFGIPMYVGTVEDVFAADPQGRHMRLLAQVGDTPMDSMWPALRARVQRRRCSVCAALCWWDPVSSVYPAGEVLVCLHCAPTYVDKLDGPSVENRVAAGADDEPDDDEDDAPQDVALDQANDSEDDQDHRDKPQ